MARPRRDAKALLDRERLIRTLTFWLRPAFILRAVNRFQKIVGFDRAVALASSALTAIIPLAILVGAVLGHLGGKDLATRMIERYELEGAGAEAVRDVFAPATGTSTSIGIMGTLLLIVAVLSFTRAMQRLFEQTWELSPLSVRNTLNGLQWAGGLLVFVLLTGWLHTSIGGRLSVGAALVTLPLYVVFFVWTGWILSARRIAVYELVPFGVIGAIATAVYTIGATVYVPHMFTSFAARYGSIGAVFAMISTLFCIMVVLVGSVAVGREVREELARIRSGDRPPDDEVRREWDNIVAEARLRWQAAREQIERRRTRENPPVTRSG
jgi:uncharacterized BrkB/YihY/UPF0761 family membrane protein